MQQNIPSCLWLPRAALHFSSRSDTLKQKIVRRAGAVLWTGWLRSVPADSNTGRSTLILRVLEELRAPGNTGGGPQAWGIILRKAGAKTAAGNLDAGAAGSLYSSPWGWTLEARQDGELDPERAAALLRELTGCGVILAEGYKAGPFPRIAPSAAGR